MYTKFIIQMKYDFLNQNLGSTNCRYGYEMISAQIMNFSTSFFIYNCTFIMNRTKFVSQSV